MQNIFPIAQKAAIEPTIGIFRPNAIPPADQSVKESTVFNPKTHIFNIYPKWFKENEVSEIEKNFVLKINKNFFYNKNIKTQEEIDQEKFNLIVSENSIEKKDDNVENTTILNRYIEIRNAIINTFKNSNGYIPLNSVLLLNYDYRIAAKIFDFLEDNKIINFQVDLSSVLTELESILCEDPNNYDKNLNFNDHEIIDFPVIKEKYFKKEILENSNCSCGLKAQYFTSDMVFTCKSCFESGKYPLNYSSRNFHEITDHLLNSIWTKHEEYILLKNIENVGDDWSKVCEGLNKDVDQCIFHFIKMSIIDDCKIFPSTPFTQVPNPISTFVAFVCSMIYPSISTELAKNAIRYLNSPNLMDILLDVSKSKSKEILELEKKKYHKLQKIQLEAKIKRIMVKIDAINEMNAEMQAVKCELEDQREKLISESIRNE